jgi:hypothetical protein
MREMTKTPKRALTVRRNERALIKLRRAVALLEPRLSVEAVCSMHEGQLANVIMHYALHVDAARGKDKTAKENDDA